MQIEPVLGHLWLLKVSSFTLKTNTHRGTDDYDDLVKDTQDTVCNENVHCLPAAPEGKPTAKDGKCRSLIP